MFRLLRKTVVLFLFFATPIMAGGEIVEPTLTLENGDKRLSFSRSDLLKRSDLKKIEIKEDPSYPGRVMTYQAVPVAALFAQTSIAPDAVIEFKCSDGFAATISQSRILNSDPKRSVAYLAIESVGESWPSVKPNGPSAGPFYLIWSHPELSSIAQEEWPFQLAGFAVKGSLQAMYPAIFPAQGAPSNIQRGFKSFSRNCFPCHTMNKSGPSDVGPDLNVPSSVTEYFTPGALRTLIRNPQDLRYFPRSRMSAFPTSILPDAELEDLIAYLGYMSKLKRP
jgi:mono/diheme cytochrome c family protein